MGAQIDSLLAAAAVHFDASHQNSITFYAVHNDDDKKVSLGSLRQVMGQNIGLLATLGSNQTITAAGTYLNFDTTTYDPDSLRVGVSSVVCQIPNDKIAQIKVSCSVIGGTTTSWQRHRLHINGADPTEFGPVFNMDHGTTRWMQWTSAPVNVSSGDLIQIIGEGGANWTSTADDRTWVSVIPWSFTR